MKQTQRHDAHSCQLEADLTAAEFIDLLHRSTLAARRPIEDVNRIDGMLRHASLIATVRNPAGTLIGVARAITDFNYCTYLSDLAVDVDYQRQGLGRELIKFIHQQAGLTTRLILLAAPAAASYYPHIGMVQHNSCWTIPPIDSTS